MSVMNGIILHGKTLQLVRLAEGEKNDTCYRCALQMRKCGRMCMCLGESLGYTVAASSRMYFIEK